MFLKKLIDKLYCVSLEGISPLSEGGGYVGGSVFEFRLFVRN